MSIINKKQDVPRISTGQPSTLGTYRQIASILGPEAVAFIDKEIADAPNGEDEVVIADESQMMYLLGQVASGGKNEPERESDAGSPEDIKVDSKEV